MVKNFFPLLTVLLPLTSAHAQCPGGVCAVSPGSYSFGGGWGGGPSLMSTGWAPSGRFLNERFSIGPRGGFRHRVREYNFGGGGFGGGFGGGGWGGGVQSYSAPVVLGGGGGWSGYSGGVQSYSMPVVSGLSGGGCYSSGAAFSAPQSYTFSAPQAYAVESPRVISYQVQPPRISSAVESPMYVPVGTPQVPPKSVPVPQKVTPQASPQTFTSPQSEIPPAVYLKTLPVPSKPAPQTPPAPAPEATPPTPPPPAEQAPATPPPPANPPTPQQVRRARPPRVVTSTVARHVIPPAFFDLPSGTVVSYKGDLFLIHDGYMTLHTRGG